MRIHKSRAPRSRIPAKPYLKPWLRVTHEATRAIFHYGDTVLVCEGSGVGESLPRLVSLLDGYHTVEAIVEELGAESAALVRSLVGAFASRGLLANGAPVPTDVSRGTREMVHFLAAARPAATSLEGDARRLIGLQVGVIGNSHTADESERAITALGAKAVRLCWDAASRSCRCCDVVVVAPGVAELPQLPGWNRRALQLRSPWLAVLPFDGTFAAVGPLYVPGETACYECFLSRRAANVPYAEHWWSMQETPGASPSPLPVDLTLAGLTAFTLARWWLRDEGNTPGAFLALELASAIRVTHHVVHRVPHCLTCAAVAGSAAGASDWGDAAWRI